MVHHMRIHHIQMQHVEYILLITSYADTSYRLRHIHIHHMRIYLVYHIICGYIATSTSYTDTSHRVHINEIDQNHSRITSEVRRLELTRYLPGLVTCLFLVDNEYKLDDSLHVDTSHADISRRVHHIQIHHMWIH